MPKKEDRRVMWGFYGLCLGIAIGLHLGYSARQYEVDTSRKWEREAMYDPSPLEEKADEEENDRDKIGE